MAVCGIPEAKIASALGISKPTLLRYFRAELDISQTKVKVEVGTFIVNSILAKGPEAQRLKDERARATLAVFFAKTRMGWKETSIQQHTGLAGGDPIEFKTAEDELDRKLARLATRTAAPEVPAQSERATA